MPLELALRRAFLGHDRGKAAEVRA
jgi:hypothetical protein